MEVDIVSNPSDFANLKEAWNTLAARFPSPLLRHEWLAAGVDAFCSKPNSLATFVVRSAGTIRALAPLISVGRVGGAQLETLGGYKTGEPGRFVYSDDEALKALLAAIAKYRKAYTLTRFESSPSEIEMWRDSMKSRAILVDRDGGASPWVPLNRSWNQFESGITSRRRSDLRRYRRRAERRGEVEVRLVVPDHDNLMSHLAEIFRVEASGWKGRNGSAILSDPSVERFYSNYARAAVESGALRLFYLTIGGQTAAVRMAISHGDRLWDLKIGYSEDFGECSPGILLTHETLRFACQEGLAAHEFLGKFEPWETIWTSEVRQFRTLRAYPKCSNGAVALTRDAWRFASIRAQGRLETYASEVKLRRQRRVATPQSRGADATLNGINTVEGR